MPDEQASSNQTDHEPDFELARRNAIRENNWPEYEARGFQPVPGDGADPTVLDLQQSYYGVENVYTGHAYDADAGRPLQHKPGVGIYVDPEGLAIAEEKERKWTEQSARWREDDGFQSEGGPAAS
jgi:hypothetical protein